MVMGLYSLAVPTEVDRHGLLPPPGVTGCEPPVEVGPGVTPALLLLRPYASNCWRNWTAASPRR